METEKGDTVHMIHSFLKKLIHVFMSPFSSLGNNLLIANLQYADEGSIQWVE